MRFNRRASRTSLIVLALTIAGCTALLMLQPTSVPVSATLTELGDVAVAYTTPQRAGVSPMCGCSDSLLPSLWRGISFLAQGPLTLERKGTGSATEYIFVSPYPGSTDLTPGVAFDVDVSWISETGDTIEVSTLRRIREAREISVISSRPLSIEQQGPYRLGALIPREFSTIHVNYFTRAFAADDDFIKVSEHYEILPDLPFSVMDADGMVTTFASNYPILDLLGEVIKIRTDDPGVQVISSNGASWSPPDGGHVQATFYFPYSLRVGIARAREDSRSRFNDEKFLFDKGEIEIQIPVDTSNAALFAGIYESWRKRDTVWRDIVRGNRRMSLLFRYPPMPASSALNIFGDVESLRFGGARGSLMVAGEDISLAAPSLVELRKIRSMKSGTGAPLPLSIGPGVNGYELDMRGISQVYVDGASRSRPFYRRQIELTFALAALGVLLSLISLVQPARSPPAEPIQGIGRRTANRSH